MSWSAVANQLTRIENSRVGIRLVAPLRPLLAVRGRPSVVRDRLRIRSFGRLEIAFRLARVPETGEFKFSASIESLN